MPIDIVQVILFFALVALIFVHRPILKIISHRLNIPKASSAHATVVAKQDRDAGWHGRIRPILPVYRITFEFEDRTSVQLRVPEKAYDSLSIGSTGVLVYYLDSFRKFQVENLARDGKL